MGTFDAVLAQYEKNKNSASGSKFTSQEDRMKKYFTTLLPKGVDSQERRIRILPTKDGSSPFIEVYFHEIQVDGKWVKLFDPKQDGKHSPLNEVFTALMATGVDTDKELARTYRARKFYIVKVIDRDHEQDGPKFWRFKHNTKQDGIFDKIVPIIRSKGDITDIEKGRDLLLSLALTKSGNGKEYTTVNSIIQDDMTPLSTKPEEIKAWLDDPLTWSDVYSKKSEDYLEMVANGETPKWDAENKKWVSNSQSEETVGKPTPPVYEDPQTNEEVDEDLPF